MSRPRAASTSLALAAGLVVGLSVAGCGSASRQRFAIMDLQRSRGDPDALATLRGAEPSLPPVWSLSAFGLVRSAPEDALALIERGLAHHPGDPDLTLLRLQLLASDGHGPELQAALDAALGSMPRPGVEALLRAAQVRAHLGADDVGAAREAILRLGGVSGAPTALVADAWARLALALEFLGRTDEADAAMDSSLDRGPTGRAAWLDEVAFRPEREAAARSLLHRSATRHPGHPDLALAAVVDTMNAGDHAAAEAALGELPAPVPGRLAPEVYALKARLVLLQGRDDEGLAILRARLRRSPTDGHALMVLLESWGMRAVPGDEEAEKLLRASWRALRAGTLRGQVEAALDELARRKAAGG